MNKTDFPEAVKRCGGDVELMRVTAAMVAEDAPLELQNLEQAVAGEDLAAVQTLAHGLKGMLATFEQSDAVAGLQRIQEAAIDDDPGAAKTALKPMVTRCVKEQSSAICIRFVAAASS